MTACRKLLILVLLHTSLISNIAAQESYSISGKVRDEGAAPLARLTVALFNSDLTNFVSGTSTQSDGSFILKYVKSGSYKLRLSYVGYDEQVIPVIVDDKNLDIGLISMKQSIQVLETVEVKATQPRVVQKGDTTEYNAGSFKVNPDANAEDLISKMPGITVDNGNVQAQGEDVKKVTVDGQEFFGDDASIALKNLPAEIISKIQVFDGQSDQAQFTGIMDANTIKTINIITKNPNAKFSFGRVYSGYGTDDRYKAGGNINFFNGKQRITLLGTANNINNQNFSSEDLLGVTAGGGNMGMGGRPPGVGGGSPFGQSGNDFLVGSQDGINKTKSLGINYIDKWGSNINVNGSYFYNQTDNLLETNTNRDYYIETSDSLGTSYVEDKADESSNINHRVKLKIDYKIDYSNRLIITPQLSFQSFDGLESINARNYNTATGILNETSTEDGTNSHGFVFTGTLQYMHRFNKDGRTFSLNFSSDYNTSDQDDKVDYLTYDFLNDSISDQRNQLMNTDFNSRTYSANLNFTETIFKKAKLLLNYTPSYVTSGNNKENYLYNSADGDYTIFDSIYSNFIESRIVSHKAGFLVQRNGEKTTISAGLAYQNNLQQARYIFPELDPVSNTYHSILPSFIFMHNFSSSTNIRLILRTGNTLPSVSQLQEIVDNSNPLQLRTGNSNLMQDKNKMLIGRFGTTNQDKARSFFAFFMLQHKNDYIGSSTWIARDDTLNIDGIELAPNTQLTSYENYDNYLNTRMFMTFGLPLYWMKSNLNLNGGFGFNRIPGETNGVLNYAYNTNLNIGAILSSNISENLDFTLSYSANMNWANNSFQQNSSSDYLIHQAGLKFYYLARERIMFRTESTFNYYQGIDNLPTNTPLLIDAAIGYKFLKKKNLEARISAHDILNQDIGITRNTTAAFTEDVETNVLGQYFMFTITYKFITLM